MREFSKPVVEILNSHALEPPFPKIPSLVISAGILSYYDRQLNVCLLLNRLNRNSRVYAVKHLPLLKAWFNWELEINFIAEFGSKFVEYDNVYPNERELKALLRTEIIKLQCIRYKADKGGNLTGM